MKIMKLKNVRKKTINKQTKKMIRETVIDELRAELKEAVKEGVRRRMVSDRRRPEEGKTRQEESVEPLKTILKIFYGALQGRGSKEGNVSLRNGEGSW